MNQRDIKLNTKYIIDAEGVTEIPAAIRNAVQGNYIGATIIAKGVEYSPGRNDGVKIDIADLIPAPADPSLWHITIPARKVIKTVAQAEAEAAERQAKKERTAQVLQERTEAVGALLDATRLAEAIKFLYHRPADAAVTLIDDLSDLIKAAERMRSQVQATIEQDGSDVKPKRDDDGVQRLHSIASLIHPLGGRYSHVIQSVAAYEAQAKTVNMLTNNGVDFDQVGAILYPEAS